MGVGFRSSEPLQPTHDLTLFSSGEQSLDAWLRDRGNDAQERGSARTYVICDSTNRVAGYYALSAGSILRADAPGNLRRNMPDPLPVIVLGRLAVDSDYQGHGLGSVLIHDAMLRTLHAASTIGAVALVLHALNTELRPYYQQFGFTEYPADSLKFFLALSVMRRAIG